MNQVEELPVDQAAVSRKLDQLKIVLRENIIGQDHVLGTVTDVLCCGELGLSNPLRPKGSFLFLGPTGVGKTETTLTFANFLFGPGAVCRLDMSEYQEQSKISLLIGEDRRDVGLLGNKIKAGARVILFDEIEKAHPKVLDLLLQVLDAGRITVATGETLDLTGLYIVCTSNIGAANLMNFAETVATTTQERVVFQELEQALRPELVGRFNEKIVFRRLSYEVQRKICLKVIQGECQRLATSKGVQVEVTPEAVEFLMRGGITKKLGARPMRDFVTKQLLTAVARELMAGRSGSGSLRYNALDHRLDIAQ